MPQQLDLTGKKIKLTYYRVMQWDSANNTIRDGLGNALFVLTSSIFVISEM